MKYHYKKRTGLPEKKNKLEKILEKTIWKKMLKNTYILRIQKYILQNKKKTADDREGLEKRESNGEHDNST